jgi:hypothetical protein
MAEVLTEPPELAPPHAATATDATSAIRTTAARRWRLSFMAATLRRFPQDLTGHRTATPGRS